MQLFAHLHAHASFKYVPHAVCKSQKVSACNPRSHMQCACRNLEKACVLLSVSQPACSDKHVSPCMHASLRVPTCMQRQTRLSPCMHASLRVPTCMQTYFYLHAAPFVPKQREKMHHTRSMSCLSPCMQLAPFVPKQWKEIHIYTYTHTLQSLQKSIWKAPAAKKRSEKTRLQWDLKRSGCKSRLSQWDLKRSGCKKSSNLKRADCHNEI